jgi:hypothetical protein
MNKRLIMRGGNGGLESYEDEGKDDVMVTWGSPFVPLAFKTFGMFNIHYISLMENH